MIHTREWLNAFGHKVASLRPAALIWLVFFLITSASDVVASNVGKFTAFITPGTCDVAMDSGKDAISLGRYDSAKLTNEAINKPLLASSDEKLKLTCSGLPSAISRPTLTLSGDADSTYDTSVFRSPKAGDDTSHSLGIRVQLRKSGDTTEWDSINYMNNTDDFQLDDKTTTVPVRFTMWCKPIAGESYKNCKETGTVAASLTFSFDYK